MVFWDFCAEQRMRINNLNDRPLFQIQVQNTHLATFGEEGDISNVCQFKWYDWAYAMDGAAKFPNQSQFLCRVLGTTKNDGNEMSQWCLKANGKIPPRRSVVPLTTSQLNKNEEIMKQNVFTNCIRKMHGDSIHLTPFPIKMEDLDFVPYEDDGEKNTARFIPETEAVDSTGLPVLQKPVTDRLLNNQVYLPQG